MTLEEANQIIKRHDSIIAEKGSETDKVINDNLQTFQALVDTAVQSVTKDMEQGKFESVNPTNMENWEEDTLSQKTSRLINDFYKPAEDYENDDEDRFDVDYNKDYMLKEELTLAEDGLGDPHVLKATFWDSSIITMKEELLSALTNRKQKVLPIALSIFNKVQDKHLSTKRIGDYAKTSRKEEDIDVEATLDKLKYVLEDHRSPVISALLQTEKYFTGSLPNQMQMFYENEEAMLQPLDIDMY